MLDPLHLPKQLLEHRDAVDVSYPKLKEGSSSRATVIAGEQALCEPVGTSLGDVNWSQLYLIFVDQLHLSVGFI